MQTVDKKGVYGPVEPYDEKALKSHLESDNIDRVEVFNGTENHLKKRLNMVGKKQSNNFKLSKAYSKVPTIKNNKRV